MEKKEHISWRALKLRRQLHSWPTWNTDCKKKTMSKCNDLHKQATVPVSENIRPNCETIVRKTTADCDEPSTSHNSSQILSTLQGCKGKGILQRTNNMETLINNVQSSASHERHSIPDAELQTPTRYISDYSDRRFKMQNGTNEMFITSNAFRRNTGKNNNRAPAHHTTFDCKTKRSWQPNSYPLNNNDTMSLNSQTPTNHNQTETADKEMELHKQKCDRKKMQLLSEKANLMIRNIGMKPLGKMSDETIANHKKSQKELEKLEAKRKEAAAKKLQELEKNIIYKTKIKSNEKQMKQSTQVTFMTRSSSWMNFSHLLPNSRSNDRNRNTILAKQNYEGYLNHNWGNPCQLKIMPMPYQHTNSTSTPDFTSKDPELIGDKLPIQPRKVNNRYNFRTAGNLGRNIRRSTNDNSNRLQSSVKSDNITSQGEISKEIDKNVACKNAVSSLNKDKDRGDKSDIKIHCDEIILSQDGSPKAPRLVDYSILANNVKNGYIHMDEVTSLGNKMIYKRKNPVATDMKSSSYVQISNGFIKGNIDQRQQNSYLSDTSSLKAQTASVEDLISSVETVKQIWSTATSKEIGLLNSNVIDNFYDASKKSFNLGLHLSITPYECVQNDVALAKKYYETADYEDISTIFSPVVISINETVLMEMGGNHGKHVWDLARHKSSKLF